MTIFLLLLLHAGVEGQLCRDTALFTVRLNDDSASIFYCGPVCAVRKSLSGPVVMDDGRLLLYSENGYVLYDQSGAVVDSHTVFSENLRSAGKGIGILKLAYPEDLTTLLYYTQIQGSTKPGAVYRKKLFKKRLKPVKEKKSADLCEVGRGCLFNLAHNSITDELADQWYAQPQLVGYVGMPDGHRWWSLDEFYTFESPLIHEYNGAYSSFFAGLHVTESRARRQLVNPTHVFRNDRRWYFVGIRASMGTKSDTLYQMLYVCDRAGNILHCDTLIKQTNRDAVIGEDEETFYTVKKAGRFVFQPCVDMRGRVHYGMIDYVGKTIAVRRRIYFGYKPVPTEPDLAHLFDLERSVTYEPAFLACKAQVREGRTIPSVMIVDERGRTSRAKAKDLTRDGYLVRISRVSHRDIEKKLSRGRIPLPENVHRIRDSLSMGSAVSCPYSLSMTGPRGIVRSFDFPAGEKILCARVLVATETGHVLVRVDCEDFAEALLFEKDGDLVNRFTFNRQHYKTRKDMIVASAKSPIIEFDYESGTGQGTYLKWHAVPLD